MVHFGMFYPMNNLSVMIDKMLLSEKKYKPIAIIVPHAGYIYSGMVAGQAYAQTVGENYQNIFIIGPSHYEFISKASVSDCTAFETPFGLLEVNVNIVKDMMTSGLVEINDVAHNKEHSIEVQLPIVYHLFKNMTRMPKIIPILVNETDFKLADYLSRYIHNSLFIVSSDLSHFMPAKEAEAKDKKTISLILNRGIDATSLDACGSAGIATISRFARKNDLNPVLLEYMHSGYASKDFSSVVGYASFIYKK